MLKRIWSFFRKIILIGLGLGALLVGIARLFTELYTTSRQSSLLDVSPEPIAIVFGAGLWRDGSPTPVLRDRVATAADLYFAGKVKILLMSGDNLSANYNEPEAMRRYAISLGVPESAIVLDRAGLSTYESCYRAKEIFGVQSAILVTQRFHLPRALYTCSALGMSAQGVPADRRVYRRSSLLYWNLRELPATLNALIEVHITRPLPILGNPEPILLDAAH